MHVAPPDQVLIDDARNVGRRRLEHRSVPAFHLREQDLHLGAIEHFVHLRRAQSLVDGAVFLHAKGFDLLVELRAIALPGLPDQCHLQPPRPDLLQCAKQQRVPL